MHNKSLHLPFSPVPLAFGIVSVLAVAYIGLISIVMSYAALTVEFSQSVRNDEASVASFERQYLDTVASITATDYIAEGYVLPLAKTFVRAKSVTALR